MILAFRRFGDSHLCKHRSNRLILRSRGGGVLEVDQYWARAENAANLLETNSTIETYLRQHRIDRYRADIMNSGRSGCDSAVLSSPRYNRGGERRPVRFAVCRSLVDRAWSLDHRPSA